MKILVIGGSYFYGRVFVMLAAKEHDITVINRGTYSMAPLDVKEIKGDRKEENLWRNIHEDFDVIVDFCAYEKGDIAGVLRNMQGNVKQYIFISTVDVYARGVKGLKDENTPLETRHLPGEAGSYIAGKVALEREIQEECKRKNAHYTVLRPAILYGPFNYAPRESAYIQLMVQNRVLPHITDASGQFQFVYVKDAAEAILKCLLNEKAYGQAYNLCQEEIVTYERFYEELRRVSDVETTVIPLSLEEALEHGIPIPFPAMEAETELYANEKSKRELGANYICFFEGMERTWRAFKGVYANSQ